MNQKEDKTDLRWKDALLKSSLPLEHVASETLHKNKVYVCGPYNYMRTNENGLPTEFSVDVRAFELLRHKPGQYWGSLEFLIECKYCHPGIKWIFNPHLTDITISSISIHEDLCTSTIKNKEHIYKYDSGLTYCDRGIQLNISDVDTKSINHGLGQLSYAIPQLLTQCLSMQASTFHDEDMHINFLCPILLTTAELRTLKTGLTLDAYRDAKKIDDISDKVDALVLYQESSPALSDYSRSIYGKFLKDNPSLHAWLEELQKLSKSKDEWQPPQPTWGLQISFESAINRILVLNIDAFEKT